MRRRATAAACALLALACASGGGPPLDDPLGARFRCGNTVRPAVCLPIVRSDCGLAFIRGEGIPAEPTEHLTVLRGGRPVTVRGPADLAGCVSLRSADDVLSYLRFFSSYATQHWFDDPKIEVFEKPAAGECVLVCLAPGIWRDLHLQPAGVRRVDGGWEATRIVMRRIPDTPRVRISRLIERVTDDGTVTVVREEPIPATVDQLGEIAFPDFL